MKENGRRTGNGLGTICHYILFSISSTVSISHFYSTSVICCYCIMHEFEIPDFDLLVILWIQWLMQFEERRTIYSNFLGTDFQDSDLILIFYISYFGYGLFIIHWKAKTLMLYDQNTDDKDLGNKMKIWILDCVVRSQWLMTTALHYWTLN